MIVAGSIAKTRIAERTSQIGKTQALFLAKVAPGFLTGKSRASIFPLGDKPMNWKRALIVSAGIFFVLLPDVSGPLRAWAADDPAVPPDQLIVIRINTADFLGRYNYEASISQTCDFLLKEINPRCPDQRGEFSFNVANVKASVDDYSKALLVKSASGDPVIRQRLYFRGSTVKARRFCKAPEGSILKSEDEMLTQKLLVYSENAALLGELAESINELAAACREELPG